MPAKRSPQRRAALTFAPDRGLTRSIVGRASYTIDPNRSVAFETAIRQNGDGAYGKAEYSQARGQHWRATLTGALIGGEPTIFSGSTAATRTVARRFGIVSELGTPDVVHFDHRFSSTRTTRAR